MIRLRPGEVEIEVTNEVPDGTAVLFVELADTQRVAEQDRDEPGGEGVWN